MKIRGLKELLKEVLNFVESNKCVIITLHTSLCCTVTYITEGAPMQIQGITTHGIGLLSAEEGAFLEKSVDLPATKSSVAECITWLKNQINKQV